MSFLLSRFRSIFRPVRPVPAEYRPIFIHLYFDVIWYGILNGTTLSFIGVYATRIGASPQQIGMLTAIPGLASLMFSLPIGSWLGRRPMGKAVLFSSVLQRLFYLLFVFMPILLAPHVQVWLIIVFYFVMTIPGTALTVGFNALFAELVPIEWRAHVFGLRMAYLSIITTVFSFFAGYLLDLVTFPLGYEIVFLLGFLGAALSSVHLYFIMRIRQKQGEEDAYLHVEPEELVEPGQVKSIAQQIRELSRRRMENLRLDCLNGKFARIMGLLFSWHFAQYLVIPVINPYIVNQLHLTDHTIGLGNGLFSLMTFLGSLRLSQVSGRWGNKAVTGAGILGVSFFPIFLSFARGPELYIVANLWGGLAWSLAGGAVLNYILDNVPPGDRPAYLAWYSVVMNAAILSGSLIGPAVAAQIGFALALGIYGLIRFSTGLAILRWG